MAACGAMYLKIGVLVTALMLLVVGCTNMVDGRGVIAVPPPGAPIEWRLCQAEPTDESRVSSEAECGMLSVPVDYAKPDGDVARLAMIRFKATGEKIGSLFINPGGPGESGVEGAASLVSALPQSVRERFDLIGFDPRGVANSTPAVWCNSDADNDRLRADPQVDYTPEGVEHIEGETKDFVQRCVDKMGEEFLANVGTASVVKDLEAMRIAVGDDKLTYLGYSYGTRIGSSYAEAHPDKVRAMILDGAVDPNADPTEANIRQAKAFQTAFNDFAADCAATDAQCPLGADPAKAVDVYRSMVEPLVEKPLNTRDPRGLSYSDSVVGTILPLYSPNLWRHLTQALTEMKDGEGDTMLALADLYMGRDEEGHYNNSTDVRVAVNCVDKPAVKDRAKVVEEDRRAREVAPFMSYGEFTGHAPLGTCAFWPVPPTTEPHEIKVDGLPPILVISTTNDPATPYEAGVDLARQLGGTLLTFEGTQHTVAFQGNECVDDIAARYLVDVVVPPPDTRCT
jgi:pimeloyl-ACP methyl ester carboxylesterase